MICRPTRLIPCVLLSSLLLSSCSNPTPTTPTEITYQSHRYVILRADPAHHQISLAWKRPDGTPYKSLAAFRAQHPTATFATNGGIFDKSLTPLGLYIESHTQLLPLNTADGQGNFYLKPNGVLIISPSGTPSILPTTSYTPTNEPFALQSGPLLVIANTINPAFDPTSTNRRIRSAIGIDVSNTAIFILSKSPITFHELATLFRDHLHCPNALYLDGDLSTFSPDPTSPTTPTPDIASIIYLEPRHPR